MAVTEGMRRTAPAPERRKVRAYVQPAFAAAATSLILAGGGALWLDGYFGRSHTRTASEWVATDTIRKIQLADGTTTAIEPGSAIRSDFSGPVRSVVLERGIARFDVAHDARHPFVVNAGDRKIVAIGTRFSVALRPHGIVVTLYQGAVEVAATGGATATAPVRMMQRQRLTIDNGHAALETIAPGDETSASNVDDVAPTPLSHILAVANRTATLPIRLADPAIGNERIQGRFDTDDTEALARQIGAALDLVVSRGEDGWLLSKR